MDERNHPGVVRWREQDPSTYEGIESSRKAMNARSFLIEIETDSPSSKEMRMVN